MLIAANKTNTIELIIKIEKFDFFISLFFANDFGN